MYNSFSFNEFLDYEKYKNFRIDFLMFSDLEQEGIKVNIESDKITFNSKEVSLTEFTNYEYSIVRNENLNDLDQIFINNYLIPEIKKMYDTYLIRIEDRREKENKYSVIEKTGYYDEIESYFIKTLEKIEISSYLNSKVKNELVDVVNALRDFVFDKKAELIEPKNEKIPFNLSREQIAIIFSLMYKNNIINNSLSQPQLAKIIEDTFCHNKTENISHIRNLIYKYSKPNSLTGKQRSNIKQLIFDMLS
ncbi:hypothetical protein QLS71_006310 [Mariniflexile litorale]|uniref:RteC protein n=1 Tax=Mariniflexile litorale TaxID=3045158 RepID=A0AAU7EHF5_9FLAO|nr:hypothetical protein [Mariniflexile sp. KMM 9835]MDQ8211190.1 hypothetical protein [Mariniflexile sp. KMM 9835]